MPTKLFDLFQSISLSHISHETRTEDKNSTAYIDASSAVPWQTLKESLPRDEVFEDCLTLTITTSLAPLPDRQRMATTSVRYTNDATPFNIDTRSSVKRKITTEEVEDVGNDLIIND